MNPKGIGAVFTPECWADWLIEKGAVYEEWLRGKSICDPAGGGGIFILRLLHRALRDKVPLKEELLRRLGYVEISSYFCKQFEDVLEDLPGNKAEFIYRKNSDIILNAPDRKFDILIGNPPWCNFCDLPEDYKKIIKDYFVSYGLSHKNVLLGASRTDLAALVLNAALGQMLNPKGKAFFFLPSSLFFGDDASRGWRRLSAAGRDFHVSWLYEFTETRVFKGVGTSYCAAGFQVDKKQVFPVRGLRESSGGWTARLLAPLSTPSDQWVEAAEIRRLSSIKIHIAEHQMPRQGLNTCGANSSFIFTDKPDFLPAEYLYPLVSKETWKNKNPEPYRWVFIPYNSVSAKPLLREDIEGCRQLRDYLLRHKDKLTQRKGTLIRSAIEKGYWWALLGVGIYSFAPYKVIWQSYGQKNFNPVILAPYKGTPWQGNQAMHAFIPCRDMDNAERILNDLRNPDVEKLLKLMNGGGKCNWAQPGKMKKIIGAL